LAALDDEVDVLHAAIVGYLGRLSQRNLGTADSAKVYRYVTAANSIEGIGDLVETNLVGAGLERLHSDLLVSLPTQEALEALHARVSEAMEDVLEALDASDRARAQDVMDAKAEINRLAARAEHHLAHRLAEVGPERLPIYRVESEIVEYLKRVYSFARRIARGILEVETGAPPPAAPEGRAGIGA
jgi:phosphate:Na+ symporter